MTNDLVDPDLDLAGFAGWPFDPTLVDSAVARIRARAGWHIAPVRTETLTLMSWGDPTLTLPTLRLLSVSAVRFGVVTYTDYVTSPMSLYRPGGWPLGLLQVDLVHGYATCPPELLGVIAGLSVAQVRDPSVTQVVRGPFSESYNTDTGMSLLSDASLVRHTIPAGVA